jgi:hypothetical protein
MIISGWTRDFGKVGYITVFGSTFIIKFKSWSSSGRRFFLLLKNVKITVENLKKKVANGIVMSLF